MAKMYRKKRVSHANDNTISGDVHKYTNYEMGIVYWQTDKPLPSDCHLHMAQGFKKGAREQDLVLVAEIRHKYRLGLVSILPRYRYMVQGIRPFIFTDKAAHPLKRGQGERLPHLMRQKQAKIDADYKRRAFK